MYYLIKDLETYFSLNQLTINVSKTKLIVFRAGGVVRLLSSYPLRIYGEMVEIVSTYTYLGVVFSSSALGRSAALAACDRGRIAVGSVINILARASADSWDASTKLFTSIVSSTLLYAAPTWALRYPDTIETIQLFFYKRLLLLPSCTPGYLLRLEVGSIRLLFQVVKLTFKWFIRVLNLPDDRLPKICLRKFMDLAAAHKVIALSESSATRALRYNPILQLEALLKTYGIDFDCSCTDPGYWISEESRVLLELESLLRDRDRARAVSSTFCQLSIPYPSSGLPARYLNQRLPIAMTRIKAQTRLANNFKLSLAIKRTFHKIDPTKTCQLCSGGYQETLLHILLDCQEYTKYRHSLLGDYLPLSGDPSQKLQVIIVFLDSDDSNTSKSLYFFMKCALKFRALSLEPSPTPSLPAVTSQRVNLITNYFNSLIGRNSCLS